MHRRLDTRHDSRDSSRAVANYMLSLPARSLAWHCHVCIQHSASGIPYESDSGLSRSRTGRRASVAFKALSTYRFVRWASVNCVLIRVWPYALGVPEALAGRFGPNSTPAHPLGHSPCPGCLQGWPHVWLRTDAAGQAADYPLSSISAERTCFVCRQVPAKVGRRAGRLLGGP